MNTTVYHKVINGEIVEYNKSLPFQSNGVSFSVNATDSDLIPHGFYPQSGSEPTYDPFTHRVEGVTYGVGTNVVNKIYTVVEKSVDEVRTQVKTNLSAKRKEVEQAGVTVGTDLIDTTIESQNRITGAKLFSDLNPTATVDFKGTNGWVTLTNAEITAIAQAVGTHVQTCFTNERLHSEAITALATLTELRAYDFTTGW